MLAHSRQKSFPRHKRKHPRQEADMAPGREPKCACTALRHKGIEHHLVAERVQFASKIQDVKPAGRGDADFKRSPWLIQQCRELAFAPVVQLRYQKVPSQSGYAKPP